MDAVRRSARILDDVVKAALEQGERSGRLPSGTGLAVAVIEKGEVAYQGAFGLRDSARNLPVTTRTVFDVGSLTKAMTAAAFVKAAEQGALDLDEPLINRRTIALRGPASNQVSLADVLAHRVGLPSHDLLWYFGDESVRQLADRLSHLQPVPGAFRETFVYSNTLYACTRLVAEDVLRRSFDELLAEQLFSPLRLRHTSLSVAEAAEDEALPYFGVEPAQRKAVSTIAPAGGARSNVEDLSIWAAAQLGHRPSVLSASVLRTLHTPTISAAAVNPMLLAGLEWLGTPGYGAGWFTGAANGSPALFHMGFIDGFSSVMVLFPGLELGFVVLCNSNFSAFPGALTQQLWAQLTNQFVAATATTDAPVAPAPPLPLAPPSPRLEGTYVDPAYGPLEVQSAPEGPVLIFRGNRWPLRFHSPRQASFVLSAFGLPVPLPAAFQGEGISIPFSLDPGVPAQTFTRVPQ